MFYLMLYRRIFEETDMENWFIESEEWTDLLNTLDIKYNRNKSTAQMIKLDINYSTGKSNTNTE